MFALSLRARACAALGCVATQLVVASAKLPVVDSDAAAVGQGVRNTAPGALPAQGAPLPCSRFTADVPPLPLQAKHRARFFSLADAFLASGMVPAYTVGAFVKRLARLALGAPPAGALLALAFMHNLMRRHPATMQLLHRPPRGGLAGAAAEAAVAPAPAPQPLLPLPPHVTGAASAQQQKQQQPAANGTAHAGSEQRDAAKQPSGPVWQGQDVFDYSEPDPANSRALDSSLWELEALRQHANPQVGVGVAGAVWGGGGGGGPPRGGWGARGGGGGVVGQGAPPPAPPPPPPRGARPRAPARRPPPRPPPAHAAVCGRCWRLLRVLLPATAREGLLAWQVGWCCAPACSAAARPLVEACCEAPALQQSLPALPAVSLPHAGRRVLHRTGQGSAGPKENVRCGDGGRSALCLGQAARLQAC